MYVSLFGAGEVTVKGVRCPIVGRISSAVATIDVTNVEQITGYPVRIGDRVILMGTTNNTDTAEDMAHRLGTSFDEITASIIGANTEYVVGSASAASASGSSGGGATTAVAGGEPQ